MSVALVSLMQHLFDCVDCVKNYLYRVLVSRATLNSLRDLIVPFFSASVLSLHHLHRKLSLFILKRVASSWASCERLVHFATSTH